DWNDLVSRGKWAAAIAELHATNNFPEFTGRICPAPCENACVLGINEDPVSIEQIEMQIADRAWAEGWIKPEPPEVRTGKKIAIVGSGPAGMAAAQQLNRAGHTVVVFERDSRPGGLLMYGIPDFKLGKDHVWRRIKQMEAEGVEFRCNASVGGEDLPATDLLKEYDAVLITAGSRVGRDLPVPGRDLNGVHFAMEFLPQQNKRNQGDLVTGPEAILATGKDVIVIGGGDTGSDCVGTSNRQGAKSVVQFELLDAPPKLGKFPRAADRPIDSPWPDWTRMLRTSTSHEEGCERFYSVATKQFAPDDNGCVASLVTVELEWSKDDAGRLHSREVPGTEKVWPAQLVLLAMGFVGPEKTGMVEQFGLALDPRGNIKCDAKYRTSKDKVFAAGDARRGQSLVVWAIHEGREAARCIDESLMGFTNLPSANAGDFVAAAAQ
ncbi:MAG TPA: glutamate synthase subunit beta, partial [Pirellulales bacterium]